MKGLSAGGEAMMMLDKLRNTLVMQFTILILLILVVGQGVLYTWLLLYQKSHLEQSLRSRMTAVAGQIAETASTPDIDGFILGQFVDIVLGTEDVLSVRIVDGNGQEIVSRSAGTAEAERSAGASSQWLFFIPSRNVLRVPLRGGGNVEVTYSGKPVNEVMGRFLVIPPVMQLITFIVVISAIVLFFHRKVSTPVTRINDTLRRITEGDLVAEVPRIDGVEIGSIATGVTFLSEKLSSTVSRVNALSNGVAAALERLAAALSVVRDATGAQAFSIDSVMSVIRDANERQRSSTEDTDRLARAAFDNAASLQEMKTAADEIAASTDRLFRSAADSHGMVSAMSEMTMAIARNSGEAFRAVESTSSSVEEINASLAEVRKSAQRTAEFSVKVRQLLSERGTLAVADAIDAMERIASEVDRFEKTVAQLDERSRDIEGVLSVINEVAERTNLLSLNASILAAQAGEHGRGFSIVAEEIRALSEGTTSSAKDIAAIVDSIRSQVKEAVDAIHGGVKKVDEGTTLIAKSGEVMGEILETAQTTAQMTRAVEKATAEQAEGLQQIRREMENVRLTLEQIANSTQEERRSSARMLDSIGEVKAVAELVKKGTGEHAAGTQVISRNQEESRDMVTRINRAAKDQLSANETIAAAVERIRQAGQEAMKDLEEMARSFSALKSEVDDLKHEMAVFRTKDASTS